ncbi:Fur-regulated basic protein FbpA [Peribacillus sp. SCS-37]|uniref:Fur-regulated basic protein FbpA n=1 Tax=Paraperibacillus esterisolvens TaxID=3115296 RepID=UPI0039063A3A
MPILRAAVEKRKNFIISRLIQAEVYKEAEEMASFTLTQLERDYEYFVLRDSGIKKNLKGKR